METKPLDTICVTIPVSTFAMEKKDMNLSELYQKALNFEFLSGEEGMLLFQQAPLSDLMFVANEMRKKQVPHGKLIVM
jgi:2-iminoacetate synthase ThiH